MEKNTNTHIYKIIDLIPISQKIRIEKYYNGEEVWSGQLTEMPFLYMNHRIQEILAKDDVIVLRELLDTDIVMR